MANPIISVIIRARDHASDLIRRIRDQLNDLPNPTIDLNLNGAGEAASSLAGIAKGALIAAVGIGSVTEALGAAKHAFIDYNAELEQTRVAFTSMLHSAAEADKMLSSLQKFAAETPFEMPGVRTAAQQLIAFGYEADEILPTLTALGNAASGLGRGQDGFNHLAFVFGQIRTTGKLMGQDVMQLAQLGVPVKDILAKNLGLAKDELSRIGELGIDADVAIQALIDGMNERFPDMMKKQSETFEGILSNIKDNLGQAFGGIGLGVFEEAKKGLLEIKEITDTFLLNVQQNKNIFDDILPRDLAQKITALWNELQNILSEVKPLIEPLGEALGAVFELSIDKARLLYVALRPIVAVLVEIASIALEAAAALAEFVDFGYEKILSLNDATSETTDAIYSAFGELWESVKQDTVDFCTAAIEIHVGMAVAIAEVIGSIIDAFESVFSSVAETVGSYMETATNYVRGFIEWVNSAIGSLRELIGWVDSAVSALERLSGVQATVSLAGQVGSWFDGIRTKGKVALGSYGFGSRPASKNPDFDVFVPTRTTPSPLKTEREPVSFHGGGGGGGGRSGGGGRGGKSDAEREAERLAARIEKLTEKIQQHLKSVTHDIVNEVGTVYENGMGALTKKLEGMKADIADAASLGIDTKALEGELARYEAIVKEKVTKAWREANEDIANDTALTWAQVNKNAREEAEVAYRIGVLRVEREKENKLKEVALTKDSAEARVVVEKWAAAEIAKLDQQRIESLREVNRKRLELMQQNGDVYALKKYLAENASAQREDLDLKGQQELARAYVKIWNEAHRSVSTYLAGAADQIYGTLSDSLTDFIRGVKSAKDVFRDFGNSVLSMMAKIAAQRLAARWVDGLLSAFGGLGKAAAPAASSFSLGGTSFSYKSSMFGYRSPLADFHFAGGAPMLKMAKGGIVTAPTLAMIGEAGEHEAVIPLNERNLSAIGGGRGNSGNVIINVTNNTGAEVKAEQTGARWDGEQWVVGVVLNAVASDRNGIRSIIKGVATT